MEVGTITPTEKELDRLKELHLKMRSSATREETAELFAMIGTHLSWLIDLGFEKLNKPKILGV